MTQQMTTLFVQFNPQAKPPEGFKTGFDYPVFAIDAYDTCGDNEEGKVTEFLLANNKGQFVWIDMGELVRQSPHPKPKPQYGRG